MPITEAASGQRRWHTIQLVETTTWNDKRPSFHLVLSVGADDLLHGKRQKTGFFVDTYEMSVQLQYATTLGATDCM